MSEKREPRKVISLSEHPKFRDQRRLAGHLLDNSPMMPPELYEMWVRARRDIMEEP